MTALIECENLGVKHSKNITIKDLNFKVFPGDFLVICGANGCGKTTLLRAVLGLHPLSSGTLRLDPSLKGQIGYLPQQVASSEYFPASVEEVVMSGCAPSAFPFFGGKHRALAEDAMNKLSVENIRKKNFSALSGGQQRRVLLARALCSAKKLLILDEPDAAMDKKSMEKIPLLLRDLNGEGVTVIVVTHDFSAFSEYGKTILRLGEKNFFGTAEEFRRVKND